MVMWNPVPTVVVIPARLESKRLPNKPLLEAGGKSLIEWTYWQAKRAMVDQVVVTSPDREICQHCQDRKMNWMPSGCKPTGTHRVAEIARLFKPSAGVSLILNWQVDEPLVDVECVNRLIEKHRQEGWSIGTIVSSARLRKELLADENLVKVAMSKRTCHWFSRRSMQPAWAHIGIYSFSLETLFRLGCLPTTQVSEKEALEQLAWIESGFQIRAVATTTLPLSVNTPEDFENFKALVEKEL